MQALPSAAGPGDMHSLSAVKADQCQNNLTLRLDAVGWEEFVFGPGAIAAKNRLCPPDCIKGKGIF